jgi:hypothetical protein
MRDRAGWWRHGLARVAYVVVGGALGVAIAMTSPRRGTDEWAVWASVAVALAAASGAVFGYGLVRWPEIAALGPLRSHRVVLFAAGILAAGVVLLLLGTVLTAGGPSWLRGQLLLVLAGVGATPVVGGLAAIREQAQAVRGSEGEQIEQLLILRRLLAGLLAAVGALVALATLATGAALQLGTDGNPGVVLVLGGTGSALVALAYSPAAAALRATGQALCRAIVPLVGAPAAELPSRVDNRHRLEQALGVDRGVFADLQSGLTILAPLIASAGAVFLPS